MKKFLLPENGNFYKANLHCHTTLSDGLCTPEQVKEIYKSHGYSVIAYTDHDALVPHPELADEDFLPLNGYEIQISQSEEDCAYPKGRKTCHLCSIAIDPDNDIQVGYHRTRYTKEHVRPLVKFDEREPDFLREYTPECVNAFIKKARDAGFFVTYNHPTWSLESYPEYISYENMNAMEILNYSSFTLGYSEHNPRVYDDMLRAGKRIFCIATDDNHNGLPGTRYYDACGGFTMIKAEKLEYRAVTAALVNGHFYASNGPLIDSLTFEDGIARVTVPSADRITVEYATRGGGRGKQSKYATEGAPLTEAEFEVVPENGYFRISVYDGRGGVANTNAYFTDKLFED